MISIFDIFKIGIGPSSSHTVGPMKAAAAFADLLYAENLDTQVARIVIEVYGSLALTGIGHGTFDALLLGLEGSLPHDIPLADIPQRLERIRTQHVLKLNGREMAFNPEKDLDIRGDKVLPKHPNGLKGVSNPSAIFLASYRDDTPGSCVLVTQEGSRPLLVEIQALVDDAHGFTPKRLTVGLEQNRLAMLLAVLNRHGGIACFDQDVFLNAVGGVKIGEPAADLAVILAMLSSFRNRPLPEKMVAFGEIGLSGEVRPVARGQERLKEAEKLGFKRAIVPKANMPRNEKEFPNLKIFGVSSLQEAIEICRDAEN